MKIKASLLVVISAITIGGSIMPQASAATYYGNINIISDSVMNSVNTMNSGQINSFLNGFTGTCLGTNSGFTTPDPQGYSNGAYQYGGNVDGGTALRDIAVHYDLNPQVLITTLEKEQGLISRNGNCHYGNPPDAPATYNGQAVTCGYNTTYTDCSYACQDGTGGCVGVAVGYACPGFCKKSFNGFSPQMSGASWVLRFAEERAYGQLSNYSGYDPGDEYICYTGGMTPGKRQRSSSSTTCNGAPGNHVIDYDGSYTDADGNTMYITNGATASMLNYTPFYARSYTDDKLFHTSFTKWFGSTTDNSPGYAAITNKYNNLGGANSWLGSALSDIKSAGNGGLYQQFSNGKIYWSSDTGAWTIHSGAVDDRYAAVGYEGGYLGYPRSDEMTISGKGTYQQFQGGSIYWTSSTQAWEIHYGAMFNRFQQLGYESSYLGFPVSGEISAKGGVYQNYQGGRLYWRPLYPAMDINTTLQAAYTTAGTETGYLGMPRSSMMCGIKDGGCWMQFDGGKLYWSSASGAYDIHIGAMNNKYGDLGYESGVLGYPIGREVPTTQQACTGSTDVKQDFQHGTLSWSKCATPTVTVQTTP